MKNVIFVFSIFSLLFLFSCEPDSQRDYVELEIPANLEGNPAAVKHLRASAKRVNKIMNSIEDFIDNGEELFVEISQLDTSMSKRKIKKVLEKSMKKVAKSQVKMGANVVFNMYKVASAESKAQKIEAELSGEALAAFQYGRKHIKLSNKAMNAKGDSLMNHFKELEALIDQKMKDFEYKYGKE